MSLTESDIGALLGKDISGVGAFNYLIGNALHDRETLHMMMFWLTKITHSKLTFSTRKLSFVGDGFEITKDNFDSVQEIIRLRNGLQGVEEEEENPDNEAARRVLQRRKEERLKRRKAKSGDEESSFCLLYTSIEKYTPAEFYKDKKLFKDADDIGSYASRFIFRPLKNLLTGSKDLDKEFKLTQEE